MKLQAEPLTADAFAGYGEIVEIPQADQRVSISDRVVNLRRTAAACVRLVNLSPRTPPFRNPVMERHRYSSQAFMPLNSARCAVVVAPSLDTGEPDVANCRAFYSNPGQGFIYGPNIWHCPLCVVGEGGQFVVVIYLCGSDDEEFITLPAEIVVT